MDPFKFEVPDAVEKKSGTYRAEMRDENGTIMSGDVLQSLRLTLYDLRSGISVSGRTNQDVLNAHEVTVDTGGRVVWRWLPADMAIVNPNYATEIHVALFVAKWLDSLGTQRQANHEVHFTVHRIPLVA